MNNGEDDEPIYFVCEMNVCVCVQGWFFGHCVLQQEIQNVIFLLLIVKMCVCVSALTL